MAPKWLNKHGSIVSYPGRVFGDDLAILGQLEASVLFSPSGYSLPKNNHFQTPTALNRWLEKA